MYYIYIYLDPRKPGKYEYDEYSFDHEPFYVGKGKNNRYKPITHISRDSNTYLINKLCKIGYDNIKIYRRKNLTGQEAFKLEKFWITAIGRKDLGLGPLVNLTDGGESGPVGCIRSKEVRYKISNTLQGHKVSKETREKQRKAKEGKPLSKGFIHRQLNPLKGKDHPNFGKSMSKEQREKISQSLKGKNHPRFGKRLTEKHRQNISGALKGKPKSVIHRQNMSKCRKGKPAWNKGIPCSVAQKKKIRETFARKRKEKYSGQDK